MTTDSDEPEAESSENVRDILKGFKVLKSDPSDEVPQDKSAAGASCRWSKIPQRLHSALPSSFQMVFL